MFIKRNLRIFFKTVYITAVIIFCLVFGITGVMKAYENIREVCFGEYRNAVEIKDGRFRFFDFEAEIIL